MNQDEEAEKEHITNYLNDSSNRQRQMNKKCCHSAIVYYQIADKKPIQGTDCFEKAEFFSSDGKCILCFGAMGQRTTLPREILG